MKRFIPIFILFIIAQSCEKEVKAVEFETNTIGDRFEADIEVIYDLAKGNSDVSELINTQIEKQIVESIPNSQSNQSVEEAINAFEKSYVDFKGEFFGTERPWTLAIETEIVYQSQNLISVALSTYSDTGGAHGNDSIQFLNLNPENGALYELQDLITGISGFTSLAESHFLENMKNEGNSIDEFFFCKDFQLPESIGFNEEGVILLYNTYEIASHNQGITEFVIPMDEVEKYLKF